MSQTEFNPKKIKAVIGLGNPGDKYSNTYHNAGFIILDPITNNSIFKQYQNFSYHKQGGYVFAKPITFMNNSGEGVLGITNFFELLPEEIIVCHDDSDLELGDSKLEFGRGSAGHHGIESIINHLHSKDFWRLRIGVRDKNNRSKAADFVLKAMSPDEVRLLHKVGSSLTEKLKLKKTY